MLKGKCIIINIDIIAKDDERRRMTRYVFDIKEQVYSNSIKISNGNVVDMANVHIISIRHINIIRLSSVINETTLLNMI